MESAEKIIEALETIKSVCESNTDCKKCPFYNEIAQSDCAIIDTIPGNWDINKPNTVWRALL